MCSNSTTPSYLTVSGGLAGGVRRTEALERLLQFPALEATQTLLVLRRWTETTWPASLGWPGPAGATPEGRLPRRAQGPNRCHADRLPGLMLSAGLTSDITIRLSLFDCTAGAVFTPAHTFILSIFHSLALRHEAKLCSVTGPNTI